MKSLTKLFGAALLTISSIAFAEEPFEGPIQARQAVMQILKFNISQLGAMAKGKAPYDAKAVTTAAKNIHALSLMDNSAMWPAGSDYKSVKTRTTAKPEIWSEYPEVVKIHQQWTDSSAVLIEKAGQGLSALRANLGPLADSCQSCHDGYRTK